jgi:predicted permease
MGNIGLSLITLVFTSGSYVVDGKTPYLNEALAVVIAILIFMNISMYTMGFYNAGRASMDFKKSVSKMFSMPSIYVIPLILLIKYLKVDLTGTFIWPALGYLNNGLISTALLSLGIQLSNTKVDLKNGNVYLSVFIRLIAGPALAFALILIFGFTGVAAQTILICYSVPTAVNTAMIAVECRNNEDFATQSVVLSTLASVVTLTFMIFAAGYLFPIR